MAAIWEGHNAPRNEGEDSAAHYMRIRENLDKYVNGMNGSSSGSSSSSKSKSKSKPKPKAKPAPKKAAPRPVAKPVAPSAAPTAPRMSTPEPPLGPSPMSPGASFNPALMGLQQASASGGNGQYQAMSTAGEGGDVMLEGQSPLRQGIGTRMPPQYSQALAGLKKVY